MKTARSPTWFKFLWYLIATLVLVQMGLMYKWNWFCTNFEPHRHVNKMCESYRKGFSEGTLCIPMCESGEILSLSCRAYHTAKETVFAAIWGNTKLIFKQTDTNIPVLHWYDNGVLKYPNEREFFTTIKAVTKSMLNHSFPEDTISRLTHLWPKRSNHKTNRQVEMDNVWVLVQDNEYLLSSAFWERDVFPQILGTCGPYFGVQYVEPVPETFSILFDTDTQDNWKRNVDYAVQFMELLEELDNGFKEPFHICDMKLHDFGITHPENGKAKLVDMDMVYPKSIVNKILKDVGKCQEDRDCKFFDCRGRCNQKTNRCSGVSNNNLQVMCEKIFLGWRMSNTILIPGLLLSQYAPEELMVVLRQCANPENEHGVPRASANDDIRKRMYHILVEIEQAEDIEIFK